VLNALRDQFQAERDFQSARYEQIIALLALKREAGTLNAGDLTEISRLMVPPDA
jgi:outer membrane protein TolC